MTLEFNSYSAYHYGTPAIIRRNRGGHGTVKRQVRKAHRGIIRGRRV